MEKYTHTEGAGAGALDTAKPTPIRTLHPKVRPWSVVLRITAKYVIRAVKNAASTTGTLKIFTFDGMDAAGDEIRVVSFNTAAEKFADFVEVGKIYKISNAALKEKKKAFNTLEGSEYEIILDNTSEVAEEIDNDDGIPCGKPLKVTPIADIHWNMPAGGMVVGNIVTVAGKVESCGAGETVELRNGGSSIKRVVTLRDKAPSGDTDTNVISLTLWGAMAVGVGARIEEVHSAGEPLYIAVKDAKIGDFMGRFVSSISMTQVFVDPDEKVLPGIAELKERMEKKLETPPESPRNFLKKEDLATPPKAAKRAKRA